MIVQPFFWGHHGKLIERLWEVSKLAMVVVAKMMVTNMLTKMEVAMVMVAKSRCKAAPSCLTSPRPGLRLGWRANGPGGGLLWPSSFLIPVARVYGGLVVPKDVTLFGLSYLMRTNTQISLYQKFNSNENQSIFVSKKSKETISQ